MTETLGYNSQVNKNKIINKGKMQKSICVSLIMIKCDYIKSGWLH